MKTENDFKEAVKAKGINFWQVHSCSLCGYGCGFMFEGHLVDYDSGCYCTSCPSLPGKRDWADVANFYNSQKNPSVIREMDEFWGFSKQPAHDNK